MVEKQRPVSLENQYRLIPSKEAFVNRLIERIREEPTSISLQFYTYEADAVGNRVIEALREKKKKDPQVSIQLLADDSNNMFHDGRPVRGKNGSRKERDYTYQRLNELEKEGIEVSVTNYANVVNGIHRDHKKLVVFGGNDTVPATAYVGSTNMQDLPWKDMMVEMTGTMVPILQRDFTDTFEHARTLQRVHTTRNPIEYFKHYGVAYVARDLRGSVIRNAESRGKVIPFDDTNGNKGYVATDSFWAKWTGWGAREATTAHYQQALDAKKGDILDVVTPYPGVWFLNRKLRNAAKRGAEVNLIIPANNNHLLYNPERIQDLPALNILNVGGIALGLLRFFNKKWQESLTSQGVNVYKYEGKKEQAQGMVHAKYSLLKRADGTRRSVFGSSNMSVGPISGWNREIAIITQDNTLASQLADYTQALKNDSLVIPGRRRKS